MIDTHAHLDALRRRRRRLVARARDAGVTRDRHRRDRHRVLPACARARRATRRASSRRSASIRTRPAAAEAATRRRAARRCSRTRRRSPSARPASTHFRDYAPARRSSAALRGAARARGRARQAGRHPHAARPTTDTLAALAGFDGTVVLHCFSSPALLEPALERGYYVSFAGNVTYPKAAELREAAARVPADRILAETDSPYLAPQPVRGRPNEPANVVHTLAALAEARGEDAGRARRADRRERGAAFGLEP